ncbi:MAG TPA: hypothetical protein VFZ17_07230 [Acidimicrobiia bacterium]|nr:hypothetical protein [Acidimicrobiia bacterium]
MDIKHRTKQLVATVALAGAVTAGTAGMAFAADGTSAPAKDPSTQAAHPRLRARHALGGLVAKTIGIERADLRAALKSGQSVAEIAQAHNVDPQAVVDAVVSAVNQRVDQAVANGKITAERGDTIKGKVADRANTLVNRHFGQQQGS